jgi:hypothetical protein
MRALHLWAGVLAVIVFLSTGQVMRHHQPPMAALPDDVHLMFRSRHIYIVAGGLVNLMLGIYLQREDSWRGRVQLLGSALVLGSPALLIAAFFLEPQGGLGANTWSTNLGLQSLFAGSILHLVSSIARNPR